MSVKIRLARAGAKKKPFYRVVVTDSRSPRDGRFIEIVGRYNPRSTPTLIELELDRIKDWMSKGATPSETVEKLISIAESPESAVPETAKDKRPSKRLQEQAAAADKAAKEAAEAPEPEPEVAEEPVAEEAPADEPVEEAAVEPEPEVAEEPVVEEAPAEEEAAEEASDEPVEEADASDEED